MLEFDSITTRGGDAGETSLYDGTKLEKDGPVFSTLGDIDELSSHLGVLKASLRSVAAEPNEVIDEISSIQMTLIRMGAMVATPPSSKLYSTLEPVTADDVAHLEEVEHTMLKKNEMPDQFVLPGSSMESAYADVARAVCRRTERTIITYMKARQLDHLASCRQYLNRLSDYLFILGRSLVD